MQLQKLRIPPPKPQMRTTVHNGHRITMVVNPQFDDTRPTVLPPYKYIDTMDPVEILVSKSFYERLLVEMLEVKFFVEDGIGYKIEYVQESTDIFESVYVVALKRIEPIQEGDFIPAIISLSIDRSRLSAVITKQMEEIIWQGSPTSSKLTYGTK